MPGQFLSKAERERLQSFPEQITTDEIIIFFTLSDKDLTLVKKRSGDHNLLGFALQLGTLRYLSFIPDNFPKLPPQVIEYVAQQLKVTADAIANYGERSQTRTSQLQEIQDYLGFRKPNKTDYQQLETWLLERAMEHDRPLLLFQLLIKKLEIAKIIRPGLTILERMVAYARNEAWTETTLRLQPILTEGREQFLDSLLEVEAEKQRTPLAWLRTGAVNNSPKAIKNALAKLDFLNQQNVKDWDVSVLNPNRLKFFTDTAGYTELVFAMFDLLGLQFSPRIKDLGGQRLYRAERDSEYQHIESLLSGTIKTDKILARWDDMLRVAGSLKLGWVTASLFLSKLKSFPQQNDLASSFAEYGRMIKTIFILRYLMNQPYRRKINNQLNKGERLHDLRRFLFFAHQGAIRQRHEEELTNQASCLNLITNAVVTWNTMYMEAAINQLRSEGHQISDEDINRLSPTRYEHLNPYGIYPFDIEKESKRISLRPLRKPSKT